MKILWKKAFADGFYEIALNVNCNLGWKPWKTILQSTTISQKIFHIFKTVEKLDLHQIQRQIHISTGYVCASISQTI